MCIRDSCETKSYFFCFFGNITSYKFCLQWLGSILYILAWKLSKIYKIVFKRMKITLFCRFDYLSWFTHLREHFLPAVLDQGTSKHFFQLWLHDTPPLLKLLNMHLLSCMSDNWELAIIDSENLSAPKPMDSLSPFLESQSKAWHGSTLPWAKRELARR